jgi:hypothetical protein
LPSSTPRPEESSVYRKDPSRLLRLARVDEGSQTLQGKNVAHGVHLPLSSRPSNSVRGSSLDGRVLQEYSSEQGQVSTRPPVDSTGMIKGQEGPHCMPSVWNPEGWYPSIDILPTMVDENGKHIPLDRITKVLLGRESKFIRIGAVSDLIDSVEVDPTLQRVTFPGFVPSGRNCFLRFSERSRCWKIWDSSGWTRIYNRSILSHAVLNAHELHPDVDEVRMQGVSHKTSVADSELGDGTVVRFSVHFTVCRLVLSPECSVMVIEKRKMSSSLGVGPQAEGNPLNTYPSIKHDRPIRISLEDSSSSRDPGSADDAVSYEPGIMISALVSLPRHEWHCLAPIRKVFREPIWIGRSSQTIRHVDHLPGPDSSPFHPQVSLTIGKFFGDCVIDYNRETGQWTIQASSTRIVRFSSPGGSPNDAANPEPLRAGAYIFLRPLLWSQNEAMFMVRFWECRVTKGVPEVLREVS